MPFPLTAVFDLGSKLIDRLIPDKAAKAAAALELAKLQQNGDLAELAAETDLAKGQIDVNKVEAASTNWWVSGWRPAVGWVCASALFVYYVPYCLVATFVWAHQVWVTGTLAPRPDLGITDLLGLLSGMLGIAGMRTYEKTQGVSRS